MLLYMCFIRMQTAEVSCDCDIIWRWQVGRCEWHPQQDCTMHIRRRLAGCGGTAGPMSLAHSDGWMTSAMPLSSCTNPRDDAAGCCGGRGCGVSAGESPHHGRVRQAI